MNFNFANISVFKTSNFKKWKWVILGCFSLVLRQVADYTPQYVERFYSRELYPIIRKVFENSLGLFPVPWIYVFYIVAIFFLLKCFKPLFNKTITLKQRFGNTAFSLLSFTGFMLFWFFTLWGFNYARPSFTEQMNIKIEKLDSLGLEQELKIAAQETIAAENELEEDFLVPNEFLNEFPSAYSNIVRISLNSYLSQQGFPIAEKLQCRQLKPNGILFGFGIAGIFMPYVGESNIDNGLHELEKPFTIMHEMAHGNGWTDEATANFIAYLACIHSDNRSFRYSGHLMYFRYVAINYRRINPEGYKTFRETLPKRIINDLQAINKRQEQFKTWFDTSPINNVYLNWQGVQGGIVSYSRVVTLVHSWRKGKSER